MIKPILIALLLVIYSQACTSPQVPISVSGSIVCINPNRILPNCQTYVYASQAYKCSTCINPTTSYGQDAGAGTSVLVQLITDSGGSVNAGVPCEVAAQQVSGCAVYQAVSSSVYNCVSCTAGGSIVANVVGGTYPQCIATTAVTGCILYNAALPFNCAVCSSGHTL